MTRIDFDVEGVAINSSKQKASIARRFSAIRALEAQDPGLVVSTTIPVGQSGLLSEWVVVPQSGQVFEHQDRPGEHHDDGLRRGSQRHGCRR